MFNWLFGRKERKAPQIHIVEITEDCSCCSCNPLPILGSILSVYVNVILDKAKEAKTEEEQNKFFKKFDELCESDNSYDPMHIAALIVRQQIINTGKDSEENSKKEEVKSEFKSSSKKSSSKSTKKSNSKKK